MQKFLLRTIDLWSDIWIYSPRSRRRCSRRTIDERSRARAASLALKYLAVQRKGQPCLPCHIFVVSDGDTTWAFVTWSFTFWSTSTYGSDMNTLIILDLVLIYSYYRCVLSWNRKTNHCHVEYIIRIQTAGKTIRILFDTLLMILYARARLNGTSQ